MDEETIKTAVEGMAEAMFKTGEMLAVIVEAVAGHRAMLEANGYSPTIAELMSAELYKVLINKAFS